MVRTMRLPPERVAGKAWIALHVIALASLACYWTMGYRARTERLLAEAQGASQEDMQRQILQEAGRAFPALIMSVVIGAVATAAGIGGGAFFVPLFNVLLQFSVKGATALSQATIAGGGIAGVAVTLHKKHPYDPSRPLIDFDLALMLLPVLLLGVSMGVLGNQLFPSWLITLLLLLLLLVLTERTVRKALSLHRAEQRYKAAQHGAEASSPTAAAEQQRQDRGCDREEQRKSGDRGQGCGKEGAPSLEVQVVRDGADGQREEGGVREQAAQQRAMGRDSGLHGSSSNLSGFDGLTTPRKPSRVEAAERLGSEQGDDEEAAAQQDHQGQPKQRWVTNAAILLAFWGVFVAFQLLLSHWPKCSPAYWAIFSVQAGMCLVAECLVVPLVHKRKAAARASALQQPMLSAVYKEPPAWTLSRLVRGAAITLVSGAIAGLLGIGGGMIISPLLLEFGTHPHVAAATSTVMVLFSASSAALSFGFAHLLNLQFALTFGLSCFVASLAGVLLVNRIIERSGKASIIVFLLALVIGTGVTLTAAFGGRFAIQDLIHHQNIAFSSLCT